MTAGHVPVMVEEVIAALSLQGDEKIVDATFGGGGHTRRILRELGPEGRVTGIDRDPEAAERASILREEDERFDFRSGAYDRVLEEMVEEGSRVDAVFFDLGLSSYQIEDPFRGFSYVQSGPLDMRMDPVEGMTAAEFLNTATAQEIARVLREYGDVRGAGRVAREVLRRRPLHNTRDLADAVRGALGWVERGGNPAKRVFQAVRVHINDEMGGLERALLAVEKLLVPGGRLVAITFQSGEDRILKRFIADRSGRCLCPPDLPVCVCGANPVFRKGKVYRPAQREIQENPRSASARLRTAIRTTEEAP